MTSDSSSRFNIIISLFVFLIWTAVLGISLAWNIHSNNKQSYQLALHSAEAHFNKDHAFRLWATKHNGVYVRPTKETPPNPYLAHLKNRDVITTDGMKLTLMNPAYMIRQMMEDFSKLYGITGRIIGQITLNPNNKADAWESAAIDDFISKKSDEVVALTLFNGVKHLRLIRPLIMEQGCMSCHGHLGFKVGDVRGAVSISIPMTPYTIINQQNFQSILISHSIIYCLGLMGIFFISRKTHRNVQERRYANKQLHQLNTDLEDKVKLRTHELENMLSHLKQTQEHMLESEKMASLGSLVAGIAHEINTPLGVGVSAISLIENDTKLLKQSFQQEKMTEEDFKKYIEDTLNVSHMITHNLSRATKLIQSFKQVAVDQSIQEWRTISAKKYIEEIILSLHPKYKKFMSNIDLECSSELLITTNPGSIAQIITNLVCNSIDHGFNNYPVDQAQIKIRIIESQDNNTLFFQIVYSDNGRGIPIDHQAKIFEPFFTSNKSGGGSGLGLSIVYNLINQQLNGTIMCQSEVNQGTTFIITLPNKDLSHSDHKDIP